MRKCKLVINNYYSKDEFKNYKIDYQFPLDTEYNYVIRDVNDLPLYIGNVSNL